jgi:hypothetical protein
VLIALASLLVFFSILATWARAQILDTEGWTQTSVRLLNNDKVRGAVSDALSERLLGVVDRHDPATRLPGLLSPLAGTLSGTAGEIVPQVVDRALQTPAVREVWAAASRTTHAEVIELFDGGPSALSTSGGVVAIDVEALLDKLGARLGLGDEVGRRLVPAQRRIVLLRSGQLQLAQGSVRGLRDLSVVLPVLALLGFLAALGVGAGARRRALVEIGAGIVGAGLASLLARHLAESYVVAALVSNEGLRPAARDALAIITAGWKSRALWTLVVGAIIALAGLLAQTCSMIWARRRTDPLTGSPVP